MAKKRPASLSFTDPAKPEQPELVIITGLSGSGKGTVLRVLEDLGYYSVDNLPLDLIPTFAELTKASPNIRRAALVVDIREGDALRRFPALYKQICGQLRSTLVYLEAADETLVRRFSETRRPHPLGRNTSVSKNIANERGQLQAIRRLADHIIDTSKLNVHQLRQLITEMLEGRREETGIRISVMSFGFRNGIPQDADLIFDVRFLPNPNYIPEYKDLTGRNPAVAKYIRSFPQTQEFIQRISELLIYLVPHYIREGKSYLTIAFGCTGGQHRSVMIASELRKRLAKGGYKVSEQHRDSPK